MLTKEKQLKAEKLAITVLKLARRQNVPVVNIAKLLVKTIDETNEWFKEFATQIKSRI